MKKSFKKASQLLRTTLSLAISNLLFVAGSAQDPLKVSGVIQDVDQNPLQECFLRLTDSDTKKVIQYIFTGSQNKFSFIVDSRKNDALRLTIGKAGFNDTLIMIAPGKQLSNLQIQLSSTSKTLPEVRIEAVPIWQKGDTTFHKVSAFRDGTEQNLGEIISKIPGFNLNEQGLLLYKNKIVDKILVQGEDMFSDKKSLLLANFPAEVVENIQAIENQIDNALLKGLQNGNKTVLNLELKKERLKAFGYVDAGISTQQKYSVAPILFSLLKKTKAGLVGNLNNIGSGTSLTQQEELRNNSIRWYDRWFMPPPGLEQINDLDSRHYLLNDLRDIRFKLNRPLSRSTVSETEIGILADNWLSTKETNEKLYSDSNVNSKTENTYTRLKPEKFLFQQKFKIKLDGKSAVNFFISGLKDLSFGSVSTTQLFNGFPDSVYSNQKTRRDSYLISGDFTLRSENSAWLVEWELDGNKINQHAEYFTQNLSSFLPVVRSNYNMINLQRHSSGSSQQMNIKWLKKVNSRLLAPSLSARRREFAIFNNLGYSDKVQSVPDSSIDGSFKKIKLNDFNLTANMQHSWNKKGLFFNLDLAGGFYNVLFNQVDSRSSSTAIGKIGLNVRTKIKSAQHEFNLSVFREPFHPFEIQNVHYPTTPLISSLMNTDHTIAKSGLRTNYMLIKNFRNRQTLIGSASFDYTFKSFVYAGTQSRIFTNSVLNLANVPTSRRNANVMYLIPLRKRSVLDIDLSMQGFENFVQTDKGNQRTTNAINSLSLKWEKKWSKVQSLNLGTSISNILSRLPEKKIAIFQWRSDAEYQIAISKAIIIKGELQFIQNSYFSQGLSGLLMGNLSVRIIPGKSPIQYSLLLNNISNSSHFDLSKYSFPLIGYSRVPLIKRNLIFNVRYRF